MFKNSIPKNFCIYSISGRYSITLPSLKMGWLCLVTSFQKEHFKGWGVGTSNVTVKKPNECYLSQVTKVNINNDKSYWQYVPWVWCDENSTTSVVFSQNPLPDSNHKENIRHIPAEEHSTKCLTSTPQNCQLKLIKESLRNCHKQEEPKVTWQLNAR